MAAAPRSSFHGAAGRMCLLLFFLLELTTTTVTGSSSVSGVEKFNGSCIAAERVALLSFKAGFTSDPRRWLRSWRGLDCCRWYGVSCSRKTGHVLKLDLRNDFFQDDINDFWAVYHDEGHVANWLCGQVSSSLLALRKLRHLDLSGNSIGDGLAIPEFMGSLRSLTYLDLSNMNFSGRVPRQLGNLTKLKYLNIEAQYVNQHSYLSDISWLANLHSLENLDMSFVDLRTVVDWVHWVSTLPNLRVLDLSFCELNSSIPPLVHHNLTVLENLDLSGNNFFGPAAPNWYWDVTSLKSLDISLCGLSGPFPDELGNLTMLRTLNMQFNTIQGRIPSTLKSMCSLQNIYLEEVNIGGDIAHLLERIPKCSLNSLQLLRLGDTNITGMIPKSISNFTALSILDISTNHLSGSVPVEIGKLKKLTELYIYDNNLSGSVPVEIGTLENLTVLNMYDNNFSGVITGDHFSSLTNLKDIDLTHTHLQVMVNSNWEPPFDLQTASFSSCYLGPEVPNWLRWQKSVSYLNISDTGLIGMIPDWFWSTFSNTTFLDLSYNQITGELPPDLEFMSVAILLLQSNHLVGSVPRLPRNIYLLDMSKNSLNGQLPSNFGGPNLQTAVLFSNRIVGVIPDSICQSLQLQILDLSNNLLTGELPDCGREGFKQQNPSSSNSSRIDSTNSYSSKIIILLLHNNNLSGGFPLFLKQCQNLAYLDLSQNRFNGKLPMWISDNMTTLVMLRLRSNNFSGHIPIEILSLFYLRILDLANNMFSGVIPQSLGNLNTLTTTMDVDPGLFRFLIGDNSPFKEIYQFDNMIGDMGVSGDSLSLPTKGQVLDYTGNILFFKSIDLSCNRLVGQIPKEIGSLLGLTNLNLSSNLLSGNIPDKIGNLHALESLDLSNNQLSGEIPGSLSNLTLLSYLNLSYNDLSGRIPSGHQLDTLGADDPASMYIGNPNLCGHPLPKVCPGDEPIQDPIRWHEDDKTQMDLYLGLTVGFLVGLWIIFCGLLFKRTWRYTYFSLFDKFYDKVHVFSVVTWQQWFRKQGTN